MDHLTDSRNDFAVAIDRLSGWGDHLRGANSGLSRAASYSTGPPDACAPVPTGSRRTQHRLCGAPSGPRRGRLDRMEAGRASGDSQPPMLCFA